MCVSYASRKCFNVCPTTVAFVESTDDDRLWCAHTMRQSSFRRLYVQQKTKIAWCVPGLRQTRLSLKSDFLWSDPQQTTQLSRGCGQYCSNQLDRTSGHWAINILHMFTLWVKESSRLDHTKTNTQGQLPRGGGSSKHAIPARLHL